MKKNLKISKFARDQYKDDSNLKDRLQIYRYSENKRTWFNWAYDQLDLENKKDILELGCGTGLLWKLNIEDVSSNLRVILSDLSNGMLKTTKKSLNEYNKQFKYKKINAEKIPFKKSSFDVVIALHMLYHVRNLEKTLVGIKRVLKKNGKFYASTISFNHHKELRELFSNFDKKLAFHSNMLNEFRLENGKEILNKYFNSVNELIYQNNLIIPIAEPLFRYAFSLFDSDQRKILKSKEGEFMSYCNKIISERGNFVIINRAVLFECINK